MRTACSSMLAIFMLACAPSLASAQATRPSGPGGDMARENAELKQRVEKLEAYVAQLEAKLRSTQPAPRADAGRPRPAPYGFELPAPPFRVRPAPRAPALPRVVPPPPDVLRNPPQPPASPVPEQWQRREFNGQDFYLIPLE